MEELDPSSQRALDEVDALISLGLHDEAQLKWNALPESVRRSNSGWLTHLIMLAQTRRHEECLAEASQLLASDHPSKEHLTLIIIESLRQLHRPEESRALAMKALADNPQNAAAALALARLELDAKNTTKAREYADKAIAISPSLVNQHWLWLAELNGLDGKK